MAVKLQGILRDFEYAKMSNIDSMFDYLTRLFALMNQMKMYGEDLSNKRMVEKLLISLTVTYDNIVYVIKGTKNINEIDPTDVVATFKGFKQRLKRHIEADNVKERAFSSLSIQSKGISHAGGYKARRLGRIRRRTIL